MEKMNAELKGIEEKGLPLGSKIYKAHTRILKMVEQGKITQELADDLIGENIDIADKSELEQIVYQVKCFSKHGLLDKKEAYNMLRAAKRRQGDEAVRYINDRLLMAVHNDLFKVLEVEKNKKYDSYNADEFLGDMTKLVDFLNGIVKEPEISKLLKEMGQEDFQFGGIVIGGLGTHIIDSEKPKEKSKADALKKPSK